MKQFLKLLVFQSLLFSQDYQFFEKFFGFYKFKIYSSKKEIGFINLKISSCTVHEENKEFTLPVFVSEIESYTDIPILFFIGETYNNEIEYYDSNFIPLNSKIITKDKKDEFVTIMRTDVLNKSEYKCILKKEKRKVIIKEINFSPPIITAGNAIPLITTLWDFEKEKSKKFYFIDKDKFDIKEMNLEYLGETQDGLFKIKLTLPYFGARFIIYLDKNKQIKYAEGLGLKIYAVE